MDLVPAPCRGHVPLDQMAPSPGLGYLPGLQYFFLFTILLHSRELSVSSLVFFTERAPVMHLPLLSPGLTPGLSGTRRGVLGRSSRTRQSSQIAGSSLSKKPLVFPSPHCLNGLINMWLIREDRTRWCWSASAKLHSEYKALA